MNLIQSVIIRRAPRKKRERERLVMLLRMKFFLCQSLRIEALKHISQLDRGSALDRRTINGYIISDSHYSELHYFSDRRQKANTIAKWAYFLTAIRIYLCRSS